MTVGPRRSRQARWREVSGRRAVVGARRRTRRVGAAAVVAAVVGSTGGVALPPALAGSSAHRSSPYAAGPGGTLTGRILDSVTGAGIAGARVRLTSQASGTSVPGSTAPDGSFRVSAPALRTGWTDRYLLAVSTPGHFPLATGLAIGGNRTVNRTFRLVPDTAELSGSVRTASGAAPAGGQAVLTSEATGRRVEAPLTGGRFHLTSPPVPSPGATAAYELSVTVPDYPPVTRSVTAPAGAAVTTSVVVGAAARPAAPPGGGGSRPAVAKGAVAPRLAPTAVPACPASGEDVWTGTAGDGKWETAGNWSTAAVPGTSDYVCITDGTSAVTVNGSKTVAGLLLGTGNSLETTVGAFTVAAGSVTTPSALEGTLTVDAATAFRVGAGTTLLNATGGHIVNDQDGTAGGNGTFSYTSANDGFLVQGTFEEQSGTVATGTGRYPVLMQSGSTLDLSGTGAGAFEMYDELGNSAESYTLSGDVASGQSVDMPSEDVCHGNETATVTAAAGFTNAGTLTLDHAGSCGASSIVLDIPSGDTLTNTGTIRVAGSPSWSGSFTQVISGAVANHGGTIDVGISGDSPANLQLPAGSSLLNEGTLTVADSSTMVVAPGTAGGSPSVVSPRSLGGGSAVPAASLTNGTGGTVNNEVDGTRATTNSGNGTNSNTSSGGGLQVQGTFTQDAGTVATAAGDYPVLMQSGSTLAFSGTGAGAFEMYDEAGSSAESYTLSGDVASGQSVDMPSEDVCHGNETATVTAAAGFTNAGTLTLDHAGSCGASSIVLDIPSGDALTNTGTIRVSGSPSWSGSLTQTISGAVVNQGGTFDVGISGENPAHLTVTGTSFQNDGTVNVTGTSLMVLAAGDALTNGAGGTIENAVDGTRATTNSGNGTNSNNNPGGGLQVQGTFTQDAGTVATAAGDFPVLMQSGSTLAFSGNGPGSFEMYDEAANFNESYGLSGDIASGQSVDLPAEDICHGNETATVTAAAGFTNAGTLTLDHAGSCGESSVVLGLPAGDILTNDGTIRVAGLNWGFTQTIDGSVDNAGSLAVATSSDATITGDLTEEGTATFGPDVVGGPRPGPNLTVGGRLGMGGTVNFTTAPTVSLSQGQSYAFVSDASQSGAFSHATGINAGGGLIYVLSLGTTALGFSVQSLSSYPNVGSLNPSSGPAGTTVTVFGSALTGATAVNFGSNPGTGLNVVSDTELTVVAPSGSGAVPVTVTTPSGTSSNLSAPQFTYATTASGTAGSASLDLLVQTATGTPLPHVAAGVADSATRDPIGLIDTGADGTGSLTGLSTGQTVEVSVLDEFAPYGPASATYTLAAGVNSETVTLPIEPLVSSDPTSVGPSGTALAVWPQVLPPPATNISGGALVSAASLAQVDFTLSYDPAAPVVLSSDSAGTEAFCVDGDWSLTLVGPAPATTQHQVGGTGCPAAAPGALGLSSALPGLAAGTYGARLLLSAPAGATTYGTTDIYLLPPAGSVTDLVPAPGALSAPAELTGSRDLEVGQTGQLSVLLGGLPLPGISGYHAVFGFDPTAVTVNNVSFPSGWGGGSRNNFANGDGGFIESTSSALGYVGATVLNLQVTCDTPGAHQISFSGNYWLPSSSDGYSDSVSGFATVNCTAPPAPPAPEVSGLSVNPADGTATAVIEGSGLSAASSAELLPVAGGPPVEATSVAPASTVVAATFPKTPAGLYNVEVLDASADVLAETTSPAPLAPAFATYRVQQQDVINQVPGIPTTHIWQVADDGTEAGTALVALGFPDYVDQPTFDPANGQVLLAEGQSATLNGGWIAYVAVPVAPSAPSDVAFTVTVAPSAVFGSAVRAAAQPRTGVGAVAPPGTPVQIDAYTINGVTAPEWAGLQTGGDTGEALLQDIENAGDSETLANFATLLDDSPAELASYEVALGSANPAVENFLFVQGFYEVLAWLPPITIQAHARAAAAIAPRLSAGDLADYLGLLNGTTGLAFSGTAIGALRAWYCQGAASAPSTISSILANFLPSGLSWMYWGTQAGNTLGQKYIQQNIQNGFDKYNQIRAAYISAGGADPLSSPGAWNQFVSYMQDTYQSTAGAGDPLSQAIAYFYVPQGETNAAQWVANNAQNVINNQAEYSQGLALLELAYQSGQIKNGNGPDNAAFDSWFHGVFPQAPNRVVPDTSNLDCNNPPKVVTSEDPNYISVSPDGPGSDGVVTPQKLNYVLQFQNEPSASAPAFTVTVKVPLSAELDPSTLQSGPSSFGGTQMSYDPATGTVTFTLANIDLPPDTSPPNGEGYVSFSASPVAGVPSGTQISESGNVYFDFNPPVATNTATVTMDTEPPTVNVDSVSSPQDAGVVPLSWSGQSAVGIASYNVYISEDGGPLSLYEQTADPGMDLHVQGGHTYGVAVQAVDLAGLASPVPGAAATSFTVSGASQNTPSGGTGISLPPLPPPVPTGAVSSAQASSASPDGSASATDAGTTVTGQGQGALTLSQYGSDPVGSPSFSASGQYLDVELAPGSSFTSVTVQDCNLGGGTGLQWWNPAGGGGSGAWQPVTGAPGPTYSAGPPACVSVTLGPSTSPSLSQLTGTVLAVAGAPKPVSRLAGPTRVATAVAVSVSSFPTKGSARAVVLARDDSFPDALAGGPLAAKVGGPLLLTGPAGLDPAVQAEIIRVLPAGATVYVLGGSAALPASVDTALRGLGYRVTRLAGADRYGTAVAVAQALGGPSTVLLATGLDFPDAVSAGPAAVASSAAVLLTDGPSVPPATAAYLAGLTSPTVYAVGGPACRAATTAICLAGADRYATSAAVAGRFFPGALGVGLATGLAFPDALTAAPTVGAEKWPVLLVPAAGALPGPTQAYLGSATGSVAGVTVFGGTTALPDQVVSEVQAALGG